MEKNRKNLYVLALVIIAFAFKDVVSGVVDFIVDLINGNAFGDMTNVTPSSQPMIKVIFSVIRIVGIAVSAMQITIGIKGIRVSKTPVSDKGYITAAKVFFVMNTFFAVCVGLILIIGAYRSFVYDFILEIYAVASAVVFGLFVKNAKAVRDVVIAEENKKNKKRKLKK